jgi:hypothetical protein
MAFKHSTIVDIGNYETEGLCGNIEVRMSNFTHMEDRGAIRAQHDWNEHVGRCRRYRGTLGPTYSFVSLTVPECLPDRLEAISYANEFDFLYNGKNFHLFGRSITSKIVRQFDTIIQAPQTFMIWIR